MGWLRIRVSMGAILGWTQGIKLLLQKKGKMLVEEIHGQAELVRCRKAGSRAKHGQLERMMGYGS